MRSIIYTSPFRLSVPEYDPKIIIICIRRYPFACFVFIPTYERDNGQEISVESCHPYGKCNIVLLPCQFCLARLFLVRITPLHMYHFLRLYFTQEFPILM